LGGGMVGAAVACALGEGSLRVALIEQALPEPFSPEQAHDMRVSALSIASRRILEMVGAWEGVLSRRYCPFRRMKVWEDYGETEFRSDTLECPELGYIVENRITQLALLERLPRFRHITLYAPTQIAELDYQPERSRISLTDGSVLTARLLIAADGGTSRARQAAGIGVTGWDYQQHALVLYVETAYEQQDITWQRFVPTGPQAFLPLTGPHASLVWYHSPDAVRRLQRLPLATLCEELRAAFPPQLGEIKQILGVASFPLKRQHAQTYVKTGIALVGDAAHTINPLAGQGVNIGLLDAAALAQVILEADARGKDWAAIETLRTYQQMRRQDNLIMMTAMDVFYHVFSNTIGPLKFARNLGLGVAQRVMPIKRKVMRVAMGLDGHLPKLAQGRPILD